VENEEEFVASLKAIKVYTDEIQEKKREIKTDSQETIFLQLNL